MRGVRELFNPQSDEGADGWKMTSSDSVLRDGSGRPTSAGKRRRCRNTRGKVKYDFGRPDEKCKERVGQQKSARGAPKVTQSQQIHSGSGRKDSRRSEGGNDVDGKDAVTS